MGGRLRPTNAIQHRPPLGGWGAGAASLERSLRVSVGADDHPAARDRVVWRDGGQLHALAPQTSNSSSHPPGAKPDGLQGSRSMTFLSGGQFDFVCSSAATEGPHVGPR